MVMGVWFGMVMEDLRCCKSYYLDYCKQYRSKNKNKIDIQKFEWYQNSKACFVINDNWPKGSKTEIECLKKD